MWCFSVPGKTDERLHVIGFTLPETNGLPLKMGAPWKRRFLLETIIFRGELLVLGSVIDLIDLIDHTFPIQKHRRMDRSSFDKHRPETVIPLVKMVLDVFLLVVFDGLYHGKSHFFTTIWENIFYVFQASNKQIQVVKSDEKTCFFSTGRPHLIQGYKVAPVEHGCKGEAMAWFAANYKKEEEECVLQELKDQDPGIIVCPQKLPSNQWICPGCERRTRQWDVFFSPTLKGWGRDGFIFRGVDFVFAVHDSGPKVTLLIGFLRRGGDSPNLPGRNLP